MLFLAHSLLLDTSVTSTPFSDDGLFLLFSVSSLPALSSICSPISRLCRVDNYCMIYSYSGLFVT